MKKRNVLLEIGFWVRVILLCIFIYIIGAKLVSVYDKYKAGMELDEVEATIERFRVQDGKNYVYLKYKVASVYYENIKVETKDKYDVGEKVTIYYDKMDPFDASAIVFQRPMGELYAIILMCLPILIVLISGAKLLLDVRRHNQLVDNGIVIKAKLVSIARDADVDAADDGCYTYAVRCIAHYHGEDLEFIRKRLVNNPINLKGKYVDVHMASNDNTRYYVDIENRGAFDTFKVVKSKVTNMINGTYISYNDYFARYDSKEEEGEADEVNDDTQLSTFSTATFANDFDEYMNELDKK